MKIFNWMRSRFTDEKGKSVENVNHDEEINGSNNDDNDNYNDNYNKCLLNDHQINEQWRGGYLLSIGTLGVLDPLKHYYMNQEPKQCPNYYNILDKDIEIMKEDDENNEIHENYDDGDDGGLGQDNTVCINEDDQTAALIKMKKMDVDGDGDDDKKMMMKKERITLADLFSAESAGMLTENLPPVPLLLPPQPPPSEEKPAASPPPPLGKELKKKKLMSSMPVTKISQPIQKLVKKMLKRKIHPDVEGRNKANNIPLQTIGITSEVGA